jgi:hypothetical protein
MMSKIYSRAKEVCIWLGEPTDNSSIAINFIHNEIMDLNKFNKICADDRYSDKWIAVMQLMSRKWFSRRWVVQEIALATRATVYCGADSISWKEFAVAVEMLIETEKTTHVISKTMQKNESTRRQSAGFEHISECGASLLVQATGKIFRAGGTPMDDRTPEDEHFRKLELVLNIDPVGRKELLSLEYLVCTMFIFQTGECRDAVYSMLAVARDACPLAEEFLYGDFKDTSQLILSALGFLGEAKPFVVDYSRPYSDVCRDFISFCIQRKSKLDSIQALDILCRPWALKPQNRMSVRMSRKRVNSNLDQQDRKRRKLTNEPERNWTKRQSEIKMDSTNRYKLIKTPEDKLIPDNRPTWQYMEEIQSKTEWDDRDDSITQVWQIPVNWDKVEEYFRSSETIMDDSSYGGDASEFYSNRSTRQEEPSDLKVEKDIRLPSWVAQVSMAPFNLNESDTFRMDRINADPLVGLPKDGYRNYNAAQMIGVNINSLKFRKRPRMGHYSLYVTGFEFDEVDKVKASSQGGHIPKSWVELSGWEDIQNDPPEEFWRTIVADRGPDNRNPPQYYASACKEAFSKGGLQRGSIDTKDIIEANND